MSPTEQVAALIALAAFWAWVNLKSPSTQWLKWLSLSATMACALTATVIVLIVVWGAVL